MHEGHGEHSHPHEHQPHIQNASGVEKSLAMLKYMLEHNRHHARELEELALKLESYGLEKAKTLIDEAVCLFDNGNERLSSSLELLEKGGD